MQQILDLSVDVVDDPASPMRSGFDEEKLHELAASLKSVGLIQPITVRAQNGRYEVIAGHRRFQAAKMAGFPTIRAVVSDAPPDHSEILKAHENLFREDVNPVDEARYIATLVEKYNWSPAEMSKMFGKSEAYLRSRYDLLTYPDYLIAAVEQGLIAVSAANWLVKITDERVRKEYTDFATRGGITAKRAEAWFRSWEAGNHTPNPMTIEIPQGGGGGAQAVLKAACILCGTECELGELNLFYAHPDCELKVRAAHN